MKSFKLTERARYVCDCVRVVVSSRSCIVSATTFRGLFWKDIVCYWPGNVHADEMNEPLVRVMMKGEGK